MRINAVPDEQLRHDAVGPVSDDRAGLMKCAFDGVAERETRIEGRGEVTSRGVVHLAVYSDGRIGELCRRAPR